MTPEAILRAAVRTIPGYPKPGILFRDVTTLMADPAAFALAVQGLAEAAQGLGAQQVAGIEARGFVFGAALAHRLGTGFIPLRKRGKLPAAVLSADYALEYGTDALQMHADALAPGQAVLLVDDLIATGGTALAGIDLIRRGGGRVVGAVFVIDLPDLGGADRVRAAGAPVHSLVAFDGH